MIIGVWGDDKTCKTTLALSAPKPLLSMEFDLGGFDRAKGRFLQDVSSGLITNKSYVMPVQFGSIDEINKSLRPSKIVVGMKELFYKFLMDYLTALKDPKISTIVIDTGTILWNITSQSYLQEKQEAQLDPAGNLRPGERSLRSSLSELEYREPNDRMRGIVYNAKNYNKHLIIVHHSADEYANQMNGKGEMVKMATGKKERSGWKRLGDAADLIVHTYTKQVVQADQRTVKRIPFCQIDLGTPLDIVGYEMQEPSYDKLMQIRQIYGA